MGARRAQRRMGRRAGGLDGGLATLLALGDRGAPFFRPLLVQTTLARRAAFEPHVVVPSAIPSSRSAAR
jgi:hypothetical protein